MLQISVRPKKLYTAHEHYVKVVSVRFFFLNLEKTWEMHLALQWIHLLTEDSSEMVSAKELNWNFVALHWKKCFFGPVIIISISYINFTKKYKFSAITLK